MSPVPERRLPAISWPGVLAGTIGALGVGLVAGGLAVTALAVASGGFLAGRIAGAGGLLQGAVVAGLFIVVGGAIASLGPAGNVDLVVDTAATIGRDALFLAVGAAGGWLATRS
ncbi:MAG TPA: hypothetical protein VIN34_09850 [Candidatus Limnocylindria bacterium]|jgi:hypothetical protein